MILEETLVAGGLAVALQVIALYGAKKLRGTTLMLPSLWVATAASCLLFLAAARFQGDQGLTFSLLRFAVASMTLCPLMAVLGAKRPQDRGWQWVVVALWVVLVWPAGQTLVNPAGPEFEIVLPWRIFILGLIGVGLLNYLPTRNTIATVLVMGGQLLMFSRFLGLPEPAGWFPLANMLFLGAAGFVLLLRGKTGPNGGDLSEPSKRWLLYRDAYGAFWGLRIMQRVNETAALRHWPVQLTWNGFEELNDKEITEADLAEIDQAFDTLLRRFL